MVMLGDLVIIPKIQTYICLFCEKGSVFGSTRPRKKKHLCEKARRLMASLEGWARRKRRIVE
jgi:hypothetical protein